MKIAYVFHHDAADPSVQSGRPAAILQEFVRLGHDVERIFPLAVPPTRSQFAKKVGYRIIGKHHRYDRNAGYLEAMAAQFHERTAGRSFDLVFSPGSEVVSHLQTNIPITYCAGATSRSPRRWPGPRWRSFPRNGPPAPPSKSTAPTRRASP